MRRTFLAAVVAVTAGCASNPGADGPGRPLEDTTLTPGDAANPFDTLPELRDSVMDSVRTSYHERLPHEPDFLSRNRNGR